MTAHYQMRPTPNPEVVAALAHYPVLAQILLAARNITSAEDADRFFARDYATGIYDPFLLPDMDRAVSRILRAIAEGEQVTIFSDYDCDGIPGGVLLAEFFGMIGFAGVRNHIPHRHDDGFGLSVEAVERIADGGSSLIITVDCGVADLEAVKRARALGMDVIVTDHHEPHETLPEAYAVVDAKRTDSQYPFSELCGTGVAFKLVQGLIARGGFALKDGQEKWLLDLVGIATIADMVPLVDENRIFAHYGLLVMRKGRRLGLSHLFRTMKTPLAYASEDDIGFMLAPRINAASRMGSPYDAFKLLAAKTDEEAGAYARTLDRINNERKGIVAAMVKEAKQKISERGTVAAVIVVGDPAWRPSLAGLVATSLVEEFKRPAFVWGRDGRARIKGSCRSDGTHSVVALMEKTAHVFLEHGGHHMSGGFCVKEECIHHLHETLADACDDTAGSMSVQNTLTADAELSLDDITPSLAKTLASFAPFGLQNPKPIFAFRNVTPHTVSIFGKQKAHTKLQFATSRGTVSAIAFFMVPDQFPALIAGGPVDLLAHVEEAVFMDRPELRLRIVAIVPHS